MYTDGLSGTYIEAMHGGCNIPKLSCIYTSQVHYNANRHGAVAGSKEAV